jgi:pyruvate carboxylase
MSALVAALANTERDTGIDLEAVTDLEPYWEAVRAIYRPFESGLPSPTGRVYRHEIPGGQLSNLRQQAIALGLANDFERIEDMYEAADRILGRLPKVTPSSKVVGDLALHLVAVNADPKDFEEHPENYDVPASVIGFLAGELGDLPGGWPEPFRTKALRGQNPNVDVKPLTAADEAALDADSATRRAALNRLLFPQPTAIFDDIRDLFGDLSMVDTLDYLYGLEPGEEYRVQLERGVDLFITLEAIGEPDESGTRTVMATLNGQLRPVLVRDRSIKVEEVEREKADPSNAGHVAAPFSGTVTVRVEEGQHVEQGDQIATIEAMKMEAAITAGCAGTIDRVVLQAPQSVDNGDLVAVIRPDDSTGV